MVHIHFDTATFDEIERDVKVTLVDQIGLIGGTCGLFTGFSILSGVEICYYILKYFMFRFIEKIKPEGADKDKEEATTNSEDEKTKAVESKSNIVTETEGKLFIHTNKIPKS